MTASKKAGLVTIAVAGVVWALSTGGAAEPKKHIGPDARQWDQLVDKAISYLKASQAQDGSWSRDKSPGVTGVVLTGLLSTGRISPDDPVALRALQYIESLVNPRAGHIAGKAPEVQLQNYVTSINVMALSAANRADRYKKVIG